MSGAALESWLSLSLLLSLRIVPLFAFAPPFTLMRLPRLFRALLAVGLAGVMVSGLSGAQNASSLDPTILFPAALHELMTGLALALPFQMLFAGLYTAGRSIDIQSGLGMALVIDPTSRSQTPLIGTLIAYLAGAIFFAQNGHHDVLRIIAASLNVVPIGMPSHTLSVGTVAVQMTLMFTLSFGVVGGLMLALFLTDIVIALLARTVPQMNALLIGIQVKNLVLLTLLPIVLGLAGSMLSHMLALTLEAMPKLI